MDDETFRLIKKYLENSLPDGEMALLADKIEDDLEFAEEVETVKNILRGEKIEQFIKGDLTPQELDDFTKELANSADLALEVEEYRESVDAIISYNQDETDSEISSLIQDEKKRANKGKKRKRIVGGIGFFAVAATVTILLVVNLFPTKTASQKIFESYYRADPGLPITMSSSGVAEITEGMIAYKSGDYNLAIDVFSDLKATDTTRFYLGSSWLGLRKPAMAIPYFQSCTTKGEACNFLQESEWYYGLCQLYLGENTNAKARFLKISNSPNHLFNSRASQIVGEIK